MKNNDLHQQVLAEIRELKRIVGAPKKLLTIAETAAVLGISAKTIRNQLSTRDFPIKARKCCGRIVFRASDIDDYIEKGIGEYEPIPRKKPRERTG